MYTAKKWAEAELGSAEEEAKRVLSDAIKTAESKKREALVEAKDEIFKLRSDADREIKDRRNEVTRQERRLQQREESLDKKSENMEKKEEQLAGKLREAEDRLAEAEGVKKQQFELLEKISGYTADQAKDYLLQNLENELTHEKGSTHQPDGGPPQGRSRPEGPGDHLRCDPALCLGLRLRSDRIGGAAAQR